MAASHTFRTAFRGFNREDVVRYIEFMNNQHRIQLEQLRNQVQATDPGLQARLEAAEARCAELEALLAAQVPAANEDTELEAYRRAEKAERLANDRAQQIYTQAHAVLADVTLKTEAASQQFAAISQQISDQMQAYQQSVDSTRLVLQDAVSTLYAIRPEEE